MTKTVKLNHSVIGPKFKQKAKQVSEIIDQMDEKQLYEQLQKEKKVSIKIDEESISLNMDDFEIVEKEKENIARANVENITIFLDTTRTPELEAEGFSREIVRRIQSMRKELDLHVEDNIVTEIHVEREKQKMLQKWEKYIREETRSKKIIFVEKPDGDLVKDWQIDETPAKIAIKK